MNQIPEFIVGIPAIILIMFSLGLSVGWLLRTLVARFQMVSYRTRSQQQLDQLRQQLTQLEQSQSEVSTLSTVAHQLVDIPDIDKSALPKLSAKNILTTEDLLRYCTQSAAIIELAMSIGVEDFVIQRWLSLADLMRVPGINAEQALLLEATAIYSTIELAQQKPQRLAEKLSRQNTSLQIVSELPTEPLLVKWIAQASSL